MTHHIVVLGAGYAGMTAAQRLGRKLRGQQVQLTLVNAAPLFVERVRLHQLASGQELTARPLEKLVQRNGIQFVLGAVSSVDADRKQVRVVTDEGPRELNYDTLVYALGSSADVHSVPGVADHAYTVAGLSDTNALRERVAITTSKRGVVAVVGGGSTGIEAATELAERHPGLQVRLLTAGEPGDWLSARAQAHLRRVFWRLSIEVITDAKVVAMSQETVALADGRLIRADLPVWATGFQVSPLAAEAGIAVDGNGQILVDSTLRSESHHDIYAIGDAAAGHGPDGTRLRMSCATSLPMANHAADAIVARLAGRDTSPLKFRYTMQCISLGRRDALIQLLAADDSPHRSVITGRTAAMIKETIVRGAAVIATRAGLGRRPSLNAPPSPVRR